MRQGMPAWIRRRTGEMVAGVVLWLALATAGAGSANATGLPVWETIVTWDEWAVSLLLLPQGLFWLIAIVRREDVANPFVRRLVSGARALAWSALPLFALDLLTRAVLGLGWKPF